MTTTTKKKLTKKTAPATDDKLAGEVEKIRVDAQSALVSIRDGYALETREAIEEAGKLLRETAKRRDKVEARLAAITKPMREAESSVRSLFRPAISALKEMEAELKLLISKASVAIDAKNRQIMAAASTAVQVGNTKAGESLSAHIESTAAPEGVTFREEWRFEIEDATSLPREYLQPNESAIRGVVQALKGETKIPGVRVWKDTGVAVSRKP